MRKQVIHVADVPSPVIGSHAVRAGDFVFIGAQMPLDGDNALPAQLRHAPGAHLPAIASARQSEHILAQTERVLDAAGSAFALGARIDQFCTHERAAAPYLEARARHVETPVRPASTHIQIESLLVPDALCALQMIALVEAAKDRKHVIVVPDMPASPGPPFKPAPHGIVGGDFIFVTGQVAHGFGDSGMAPEAKTDPETWYGSPIKQQAEVVLRRCAQVLNHVGANMADVVRADVYLNNMEDRFELDQVWRRHFPEHPPARTYIPTTRLGPRSCIVEVNMIALNPKSGLRKEIITASDVPQPVLHHPHAVRAGGFLFVSGLCAADASGGLASTARVNPASPWFSSSGKNQTRHVVDCLQSICRAGGTGLENVVWTQNFHTNPADVFPSLEVWRERFPVDPPATLLAGVHAPLPGAGCTIQIDAVAAVG